MSDPKLRNFHEAKWDEPVIFEQSVPGKPQHSVSRCVPEGDASDRRCVRSYPRSSEKTEKSCTARNGPAAGTASLSPAVPGDHRPGY